MNFLIALLTILATETLQANEVSYTDKAFHDIALKVNVPESLLRSICWAESKHQPDAYNHGDGKGNNHAFGICQVLYETAKGYGLNDDRCLGDFSSKNRRAYKNCRLFGIKTNIYYAAKYLRYQLDRYDDSWISAIAAYNSGSLKICKTGKVFRKKDNTVLYTCVKGGLLNQRYVDRILQHLNEFYYSGVQYEDQFLGQD